MVVVHHSTKLGNNRTRKSWDMRVTNRVGEHRGRAVVSEKIELIDDLSSGACRAQAIQPPAARERNIKARVNTGKLAFVIVVVCLSSAFAWADVAYNFIKMDCNPDAHSVRIETFRAWDEVGKNLTLSPPKNTYLMETAGRLNCTIAPGKTFSFLPSINAIHRRSDGVGIQLNGTDAALSPLSIADGDWELTVRYENMKLEALFCPSLDYFLSSPQEYEKQKKQREMQKASCFNKQL